MHGSKQVDGVNDRADKNNDDAERENEQLSKERTAAGRKGSRRDRAR